MMTATWAPGAAPRATWRRRPMASGATLFVGNLNFDCPEEEIRAHFGQFGPVAELRLPIDTSTGKRKGFGFVDYGKNLEAALAAARSLDGTDFQGRKLRVTLAENEKGSSDSRKRKGAPGGGGGGGGGAQPQMFAGTPGTVAAVIDGTAEPQLLALLLEAKQYVGTQREAAQTLFSQQPQLYHALSLALDRAAPLLDDR